MRHRTSWLVVGLVVAVIGSTSVAQRLFAAWREPQVRAELVVAYEVRDRLDERGDAEARIALLDTSYVGHVDDLTITREMAETWLRNVEAVRRMQGESGKTWRFHTEIRTIRMTAPDEVSVEVRRSAMFQDGPCTVETRSSGEEIWKRHASGWKLIGSHASTDGCLVNGHALDAKAEFKRQFLMMTGNRLPVCLPQTR